MKIVCTIPIGTLKGLLRCTPKNDVRYYLNGILIDPKEGVMVATNGHIMMAAAIEDKERDKKAPAVIIPRALCEQGLKIAKGSLPGIQLCWDKGDSIEVLYGSRSITDKALDGRFPEWRRVVPTGPASGESGQFDTQYMHTLAQAFSDIADRDVYPHFAHNGATNACLVTHSKVAAIGVIMPMGMVQRDSADTKRALESVGLKYTPTPPPGAGPVTKTVPQAAP